MRLYRLDIVTGHEGTSVSWHPSKKEVGQEVTRMRKEHGEEVSNWYCTPVDFQPTKLGVLRMLRRYTPDRDNG